MGEPQPELRAYPLLIGRQRMCHNRAVRQGASTRRSRAIDLYRYVHMGDVAPTLAFIRKVVLGTELLDEPSSGLKG